MTSKEQIIANVKLGLGEFIPKPNIPSFAGSNTLEYFCTKLKLAGGDCIAINTLDELVSHLPHKYPDTNNLFSTFKQFNNYPVDSNSSADVLNQIDLAILPGEFAVAENGAVWLKNTSLPNLAIPYITKHLILVIQEKNIVTNMHEAYSIITETNNIRDGGNFISGPSKTADIERALVIGAHGPYSLCVVIVKNVLL